MPLNKEEVKKIREKEKKIEERIREFLLENINIYFTGKEIARELSLDITVVKRELWRLYDTYFTDVDAIFLPEKNKKIIMDRVEKDNQEYFGFIEI